MVSNYLEGTTPEERGPTLHEDDLNPFKNNNNGMGALGMCFGTFFGLSAVDGITEAIGSGLDAGTIEIMGAMPEGGVETAAVAQYNAMQNSLTTPAPVQTQAVQIGQYGAEVTAPKLIG